MNHQPPPPSERLYELLEVLRPDFEEQGEVAQVDESQVDEARQELAELLEKQPQLIDVWHEIARVDDLVGEAIQDVAVPEGLQQRVIESIHAHQSIPTSVPLRVRRFNQMRAVASVLAVSLLVAASIAWWFVSSGSNGWSKSQVLTVASSHFTQELSPSAKNLSPSLSEEDRAILVKHIPPKEDVLLPNAAKWEVMDDFLDRRAVVYHFKDRHGNQVALFVVQQDQPVTGLIDRPPRRPQMMTAGRSIGAWQSDGLLYVLVSSGGENAWRSLLVPERPVT